MKTESKIFANPQALQSLANVPSFPILFGSTPITAITSPLHVAETRGLTIELTQHAPIFVKRDDLTPGFGNKTRKLEVILADAKAKDADCLITAGGPQSNHCRQTAQFGRQLGLDVHLMFGTSTGAIDFPHVGNQVIDRLFGAQVHTCVKRERPAAMEKLAVTLRQQGRNPYVIPVGGSNYLGAIAYAKGFQEFLTQEREQGLQIERIVVATSSGGIQAGLVVGAKLAGWRGEILGISIDQVPDEEEADDDAKYVKHMVSIANHALTHLNARSQVSAADFKVCYDYLQDGYGVVGDYDRVGVRTLANHGILAGPVYSGRAFGALIDMLSKQSFPTDGRTLFWHTGGAGEIEVYKEELFV